MNCIKCGKAIPGDSDFCPYCGYAVTPAPAPPRQKRRALIIALCAGAVLLGAIALILFLRGTPGGSRPSPAPDATPFSDDPASMTAASQSVVMLDCYDSSGRLLSSGSGFACFADNVIVTNYHVIDGPVASVTASTEAGQTFRLVQVLAADQTKDIAILSAERGHGLPLLPVGDAAGLQKGEKVVAIGSPLGLLNSVSSGVFSGYTPANDMNVLQFTASISSGSSGGALFNDRGEVLGITFASYQGGQNLNLAVPMEHVTALWESRGAEDAFPVSDLPARFEQEHPGYGYLLDSTPVTYGDLLRDPAAYDGTLISLTGLVIQAEEGVEAANGKTLNRLYLLPSEAYRTWSGEPSCPSVYTGNTVTGYFSYWFHSPFAVSGMLKCDDGAHILATEQYIGRYATVAGLFTYDTEDGLTLASLELLYVEEYTEK